MEKIAFSGFNCAVPSHKDFIYSLLHSGECVFELGDIRDAEFEEMNDNTKKIIEANRYKIEMCDTYFVFNVNLNLCKNVESEIAYATELNKKIMYLYNVEEIMKSDEVKKVIENDDIVSAMALSSIGKLVWNSEVFGKSIVANSLNMVRYCVEVLHFMIYDDLIDVATSQEMIDYLNSRKNNYDLDPSIQEKKSDENKDKNEE